MRKQRNTNIIVVIVILMLLLCFGYMAIFSHPIFINGSINTSRTQNDFSVIFDDNFDPIVSSKAIKDAKIGKKNEALISVDLNDVDKSETVIFAVKNISNELKAKTTVKIVDQDEIVDEYFDITAELEDELIKSGKSTRVKVEVKLKKEPKRDISGNFKILIDSVPE